MSSRKEQREQVRAERQAREQADAAQAARRRRLLQLGAVAGVVVVAIAVVVAISQSGGKSDKGGGGGAAGATATQTLFAGIPQKGEVLGKTDAPLTMTEFADLQCPFCREYTLNVLPALIQRYVRTGKVRMVFQPLVFLGPDSQPPARAALAAGQQNLLWQYADFFYRNQEQENSGYVNDAFLRKIGAGVTGLDVTKMMADNNSAPATTQLAGAQSAADRLKVEGTPTFFLNRKSQALSELPVSQLTVGEFTSGIDKALGSG